MLSEAMKNLTFEEREKQQEALHGVDEDLAEEEKVIENALADLEHTLSRTKRGSLYETAEVVDPSYVRDRDFRVMFLRGSRYDVKEAAEQMLKFFEVKTNLFGMEKLTEDITIEDLDEDDLACLNTGWLQFAGKDRPGRVIFLQLFGLRAWKTLRNELRMKFFMLMDLLKDKEVQLRGVVGLNYAVGSMRDSKEGAGYMEHIDLTNGIPLHIAAVHFCYSELSEYLICKIAIATMPQKLQSRFRAHMGSSLECRYRLSSYGISGDNLPLIPATNKVDMKHHIKWCRSHSVVPTSDAKNSVSAIEPTHNDVLYMGGNRSNNGGNQHLKNLVVEWSQIYDSGTNDTKRRVVHEIIDNIHRTGGRFISESEGPGMGWVVLSKDEVRLKITQNFRNHRRKISGCRRKRT